MEEGQGTQVSVGNPPTPPGATRRKKGKTGVLVIAIVLLLGAVGTGIYFIGKSKQEIQATPTPTPFIRGTETVSTPEPTAEPVAKEDVSIEVLNGTGIAGEAGFLQTKLKNLGYSQIETGNATSQDNEATSVVFSSDLPQDVVDEITKLLEDTYKTVKSRTSSSASVDVSITTGLKTGATSKPASTATPAATATPTSSASSSPAPSASPQ